VSKLDAFIQQAVTATPISGTSLIASLYGDALLQRGFMLLLYFSFMNHSTGIPPAEGVKASAGLTA
jgi:hypothetical protein